MAKSKDKRLAVAKYMPPLRKRQPGQGYKPQNDEVLKWLSGQTELINFLAERLRDWGYIRFDLETHTWQGVDYEAN